MRIPDKPSLDEQVEAAVNDAISAYGGIDLHDLGHSTVLSEILDNDQLTDVLMEIEEQCDRFMDEKEATRFELSDDEVHPAKTIGDLIGIVQNAMHEIVNPPPPEKKKWRLFRRY